MIAIETTLRQYRRALSNPKVTQERIAKQAEITLQWYRQLENRPGQPTSYTTAHNILRAINQERLARNLETLSIDELGLKIV